MNFETTFEYLIHENSMRKTKHWTVSDDRCKYNFMKNQKNYEAVAFSL